MFVLSGNRNLGLLGSQLWPADMAADSRRGASGSGSADRLQKRRHQEAAAVAEEPVLYSDHCALPT